jgi:DNA polymerase III alpha subunit
VLFDVHEGAIRYALAAIKGVGRQAVNAWSRRGGTRRSATSPTFRA